MRILSLLKSIGVLLFYAGTALAQHAYNELEVNTANLEVYPPKIRYHQEKTEINIGDLHGNALKLLYFLIQNNILQISADDYGKLVTIYKKLPAELNAHDINLFQSIITQASVSTASKLRFLGDDLCDRGMNDFYTLTIFKKLDMSNVPFDIVLSNHGNFFLEAFERPEQSFHFNPYGEGNNESLIRSMLNLGDVIDAGLVKKQEIIDIVQHHYLKHLKLPGYSVNARKNTIILYTHAPIDFAILSGLAKDLDIPFSDNDLTTLSEGMTRINQKISDWILSNNFSEHYKALNDMHKKSNSESPLKQILWNRNYEILHRDKHPDNKPYSVWYVHGHDSQENVVDLDNVFGKGFHHNKGPYAVFLTHN